MERTSVFIASSFKSWLNTNNAFSIPLTARKLLTKYSKYPKRLWT